MDHMPTQHTFTISADDSIYLPVRLMQVFVRRNCAVSSLFVKPSVGQQGQVSITVHAMNVERPEQLRRQVEKLSDVYSASVVAA